MKKALLIALTLVISAAFVTAVFAQAPPAPTKEGTIKEESGPQSSVEKKVPKKAPKAPKGGVKQESTAAGASEKAGKGPAPKAPKGGVKEESTPATK